MRADNRFTRKELLAGMAMLLGLAACTTPTTSAGGGGASSNAQATRATNSPGQGRTLIAYFSKTGNTEKVATQIQELTGGEMFKIESVEPYPDDYQETTEVARRELGQNARPKVKGTVDNMGRYDTIILGYPIWWAQAPMPVLTFLESYDLSGKTIAPFATAATSGIEGSLDMLQRSARGATLLAGRRVRNDSEIQPWLREIRILQS